MLELFTVILAIAALASNEQYPSPVERLQQILKPFSQVDLGLDHGAYHRLQDALRQDGFEVLGAGAHRIVVAINDYVVAKIDFFPEAYINHTEADIWEAYRDDAIGNQLVPVIRLVGDGRILLMERATPLRSGEEEAFVEALEFFPLPILDAQLFINWGRHQGTVKLFDYGSGIEEE
jgi:hypothetical protein